MMAESKYGKYIITEDLVPQNPPPEMIEKQKKMREAGTYLDHTPMFAIQDSAVPGAFFVGCDWFWELKGGKPVEATPAHTHDCDEIIGLVGSNRNKPRDLGGEIEFWYDDEPHLLTKSCLLFIPKGLKHSPIIVRKMDTPIFEFVASVGLSYQKLNLERTESISEEVRVTEKTKYGKYIVTEDLMPPLPPEIQKKFEDRKKTGNYHESDRLFAVQDSIVKGSFFMGCEWLWELKGDKPVETAPAHTHDCAEILGFIGSKRNNPRDLGGEIEFWFEDEPHIITRSCLIFIPKGVKHSPIIIRKIDTPIFQFAAANTTVYEKLNVEPIS
jgi:quercetin dioxygenase-like cupin family protein